MLLRNISTITTGLVLSRKKCTTPDGKGNIYSVLTLKSFESDGYINFDEIELFQSNEELNIQYLTQKGDIVIRLTTPFTSVAINAESTNLVITSNFAVIRLSDQIFTPEYVSLILNSEELKKQINRSSIKTTIPVIKVTDLKDLDIKENNLDIQNKLHKINQLFIKEKKLLNDLILQKDELRKSILKEFIC